MELLEIKNLNVRLKGNKGVVNAVRDVSLTIREGRICGLVGESGCGKSVTAKSVMKLHPAKTTRYEGEILFKGENIIEKKEKEMNHIRENEIAMIFQDPMTSLDPLMRVGNQISEAIMFHKKAGKAEAKLRSIELMKQVGITNAEKRYEQYPHEFSGGMLQRIMIAIALACEPKLLIADEPTTALDVTIQAQILKLIRDLKEKNNMSVLIITHDLGVVANFCDDVSVMYAGEIIESSDVKSLFLKSLHPYTRGLLRAIPRLGETRERLDMIPGMPPSLIGTLKGCPYAARCKYATHYCRRENPELVSTYEGYTVRCHYAYNFVEEKH